MVASMRFKKKKKSVCHFAYIVLNPCFWIPTGNSWRMSRTFFAPQTTMSQLVSCQIFTSFLPKHWNLIITRDRLLEDVH